MTITTFSSREFNQDTGQAKTAAKLGPVFITDRGRPAHVLLSYDDYLRIAGGGPSIVDLLAAPTDAGTLDVEFPRIADLPRAADLD
ncbi:type II toxin-antitoxin system prevent-host-death family antitoxin [Nocardia stercoris]|uniref:Antitoxin n=1 Tax=Nocardia stercoris TaxID=2483361 RepID=A0A3M2LDQ3_9NOCA|nr:type II toxin-antitoxin system prevent-host-death family antitoxin [Nocardia stercoris]RMI35602.1 type II toxin-antitoxin system Phd/YefM family antitoxin [Nocardia stercoris]